VCCADYKKLGVLKQQFPDTPIIALTATATMQVRAQCQPSQRGLRMVAF
jgi:superfamily II DNA helicase RecQ